MKAALLVCVGLVQSIKVASQLKFIEGIKFEHDEDALSSNGIHSMDGIQSMAQAESQVEVQDDPIFGSLGMPKPFLGGGGNSTEFEAAKFENYLNNLKPVQWHNDENVNTTWSSLVWAEQQYGQKLKLPNKGPYYQEHHAEVLNGNTDVVYDKNYTEDEEITSTLDSITDAEHLMGYRGAPPTHQNQAWGAKPSDYNVTGEVYNHDWWNYLTKDNGQNGMNTMHLTREQLKDEGYYSDAWYKIHGAHDFNSSAQLFDKNGQPKANVEHWEGRDNHSAWQNGDDTIRVGNKREENRNWQPNQNNDYSFSSDEDPKIPVGQEDAPKPTTFNPTSAAAKNNEAESKDCPIPELCASSKAESVSTEKADEAKEKAAEKPEAKPEEKSEEKEAPKAAVQTKSKPSLVDQEKINESNVEAEDKTKLSKSDSDILFKGQSKHQNTMNIAGEEIEVDPLEGEEDQTNLDFGSLI